MLLLQTKRTGAIIQLSAFGYKQTFRHLVNYVRFTPENRHAKAQCPLLAISGPLGQPRRTDVLSLSQETRFIFFNLPHPLQTKDFRNWNNIIIRVLNAAIGNDFCKDLLHCGYRCAYGVVAVDQDANLP